MKLAADEIHVLRISGILTGGETKIPFPIFADIQHFAKFGKFCHENLVLQKKFLHKYFATISTKFCNNFFCENI